MRAFKSSNNASKNHSRELPSDTAMPNEEDADSVDAGNHGGKSDAADVSTIPRALDEDLKPAAKDKIKTEEKEPHPSPVFIARGGVSTACHGSNFCFLFIYLTSMLLFPPLYSIATSSVAQPKPVCDAAASNKQQHPG